MSNKDDHQKSNFLSKRFFLLPFGFITLFGCNLRLHWAKSDLYTLDKIPKQQLYHSPSQWDRNIANILHFNMNITLTGVYHYTGIFPKFSSSQTGHMNK